MGKVITLSGMRMGAASPASEYCTALGGRSEIVDDPAGQYGMCTLPDGTLCEEWKLYRKECGPSCAGQFMQVIFIDGKAYCKSTETGRIYDPVTGEEYKEEVKGNKLLNYGIAMGAGALVGLLVGLGVKKGKGTKALIGAGVGAAAGAALLAVTWPKKAGA